MSFTKSMRFLTLFFVLCAGGTGAQTLQPFTKSNSMQLGESSSADMTMVSPASAGGAMQCLMANSLYQKCGDGCSSTLSTCYDACSDTWWAVVVSDASEAEEDAAWDAMIACNDGCRTSYSACDDTCECDNLGEDCVNQECFDSCKDSLYFGNLDTDGERQTQREYCNEYCTPECGPSIIPIDPGQIKTRFESMIKSGYEKRAKKKAADQQKGTLSPTTKAGI